MLLPAYWLDVFETTDARYAEIAREMMASGNYLEPFYNGIKHFHKPPLTYWLTALGIHIFGINGLGARFFGAVAAVVTLIFVRKIAMILTDDEKRADSSVLVLASSILFLIVGRIVSTDIYLTCFTAVSLYYLFRQIYGVREFSNILWFSVFTGFGFLTKGPIIFLFTLLPFVIAKFFSKEHRKVFTIKEIFAGFLVFIAIALPWYVYVVSVNDGLLNYFLYDQTVERVASSKFNRSQPLYFLPMIFVLTLFPFTYYFFKNIRNTAFVKTGRVLYLYVLVPFIIFELSTSKLPSYLLPFYPVAAILSAGNLQAEKIYKYLGYFFIFFAAALGVVPFFLEYLRPFAVYVTPAALLVSAFIIYLQVKNYFSSRFLESVSASLILITLVVVFALTFIGAYFKGYRMIAEDIKQFDKERKYPVATFFIFAPSLSFYLDDVVVALNGKSRETYFQTEEEVSLVYRKDSSDIFDFFDANDKVIIVTNDDLTSKLQVFSRKNCREIAKRGGKRIIFFCESK